MGIVKVKASDGSTVEFIDEIFSSGGMKDAYWTPDKKEVVLFFRELVKEKNAPMQWYLVFYAFPLH